MSKKKAKDLKLNPEYQKFIHDCLLNHMSFLIGFDPETDILRCTEYIKLLNDCKYWMLNQNNEEPYMLEFLKFLEGIEWKFHNIRDEIERKYDKGSKDQKED